MRKRIIFSISSDIGYNLALDWHKSGHEIIGTYRKKNNNLKNLEKKGIKLLHCDFSDKSSINNLVKNKIFDEWSVLCFCIGTLEPIGKFDNLDFEIWENSIHINFISKLRVINKLISRKSNFDEISPICLFFAGGGTNSATLNFSSYTVSKIALIKMCELLDAEYEDIRFSILGPGWVKTKIHNETLKSPKNAGEAYKKTIDVLNKNDFNSIESVVSCCNWIINSEKNIISGRNFSLKHDKWGTNDLNRRLSQDNNLYKLRRYGN